MCGGPSKPKVVKAPEATDPAVEEALRRERELAAKRKGRRSTILTSLMDAANQTKGKTKTGQ